ncbi:MAG: citrate synthase [Gammaproteobacteria bacterium]|nr:citrate synthase [Gammaproteobacteria bacterium]
MADDPPKVERRAEHFAERVECGFWLERPAPDNPYVAAAAYCHGYDLRELLAKCSYWEYLYLLFTGRRCSPAQHGLLEQLGIALANPGPRHPATRAAITASVSKADPVHILPLGLNVLGGAHLGAAEAGAAMMFVRRHLRRDPRDEARVRTEVPATDAVGVAGVAGGDVRPAPGFGTRYRGIDLVAVDLGRALARAPGAGEALAWAATFAAELQHRDCGGWLLPGVAAAALLDLGFHPKTGPGLFQWLSAPGLLAHAFEMSNQPLTALPFIDDSRYFIDDD